MIAVQWLISAWLFWSRSLYEKHLVMSIRLFSPQHHQPGEKYNAAAAAASSAQNGGSSTTQTTAGSGGGALTEDFKARVYALANKVGVEATGDVHSTLQVSESSISIMYRLPCL